jgi:hypothetical protein
MSQVEALREQFRLRDILSMQSVAEMREAIKQLAVIDPAPPEIQRMRVILHRADMAWARHAAGSGLTLEQIKAELLNGCDLGKKGSRKRQLEYAERTARKAIEQLDA